MSVNPQVPGSSPGRGAKKSNKSSAYATDSRIEYLSRKLDTFSSKINKACRLNAVGFFVACPSKSLPFFLLLSPSNVSNF